jgi:hypothetical protein
MPATHKQHFLYEFSSHAPCMLHVLLSSSCQISSQKYMMILMWRRARLRVTQSDKKGTWCLGCIIGPPHHWEGHRYSGLVLQVGGFDERLMDLLCEEIIVAKSTDSETGCKLTKYCNEVRLCFLGIRKKEVGNTKR